MKTIFAFLALALSIAFLSPAEAAAKPIAMARTAPISEAWDAQFGGVQSRGGDLAFRLGFPEMPQFMFTYGVTSRLAIGASLGIQLGTNTPGVLPYFQLGVPFKVQLGSHAKLTSGVWVTPSFLLSFAGPVPGFGLDTHFKLGGRITDAFLLGVGVDVPLTIAAVSGVTAFGFPVLFGPEFEVRALRPLSFTFESLFGPMLTIAGAGTGPTVLLTFGMKINAGVTYHF